MPLKKVISVFLSVLLSLFLDLYLLKETLNVEVSQSWSEFLCFHISHTPNLVNSISKTFLQYKTLSSCLA